MTLLSICQAAADEIGITRPSAVAGNTEPEVQRLFRYANKIGNNMMKAVNWQVLRSEQTFTASNAELQSGAIPADFDRFVPETFWDRTNLQLVTGPVTATEWGGMKAASYTGNPKFIYRGNEIRIMPTPSGTVSMAFEYVSNKWAASSGGTAQASLVLDTDVARLDEELITFGVISEFLIANGLPATGAVSQYEARYKALIDNDQPASGIMVAADLFGSGRPFTGEPGTSYNIYNGY
jgi:hypothetical protein